VDDPLTPGIKVAVVLPSEHGVFPTKELDLLLINYAPYLVQKEVKLNLHMLRQIVRANLEDQQLNPGCERELLHSSERDYCGVNFSGLCLVSQIFSMLHVMCKVDHSWEHALARHRSD
jgi:hypothetical protein